MTAPPDNRASIRRRLFITLFLPAAAVLIAGTVIDYLTALPPLTGAFDQALLESALAIAAHVHTEPDGKLTLDLPADALAILRADSKDSIYFRVGTGDGTLVAGDPDLPMPSTAASNPGRSNAVYRGNPVRLIAYRTYAGNDEITVTMGETLHKRTDLQRAHPRQRARDRRARARHHPRDHLDQRAAVAAAAARPGEGTLEALGARPHARRAQPTRRAKIRGLVDELNRLVRDGARQRHEPAPVSRQRGPPAPHAARRHPGTGGSALRGRAGREAPRAPTTRARRGTPARPHGAATADARARRPVRAAGLAIRGSRSRLDRRIGGQRRARLRGGGRARLRRRNRAGPGARSRMAVVRGREEPRGECDRAHARGRARDDPLRRDRRPLVPRGGGHRRRHPAAGARARARSLLPRDQHARRRQRTRARDREGGRRPAPGGALDQLRARTTPARG